MKHSMKFKASSFLIAVMVVLLGSGVLYADLPWLHTSGNTLRDPSNNVVILRGVATADIGAHESWYGGLIPLIDRVRQPHTVQRVQR
jgi:hypothetical protein